MSETPFTDDRYEVLGPLGSGGMATVYKCRNRETGAIRAIKVLEQRLAHKTDVLKRFENEAAAMDRLSHPHIVPLHAVSFDTEQKFIVMDFIDGESLLDRMERTGLTPEDAVALMIPVLEALQSAHDEGIVHRDIKPHNILISRSNHVFVSDFGIARCIDETDMSLTRTGMIMGTWAFMAPEQRADAKGVDHLADIYSVGATLFAAVTGQTPKDLFAAELDPGIYKGVPKTIEAVIRRACAYWTTDRYPTAEAMRSDLELTLGMLKSGASAEGRPAVAFIEDSHHSDIENLTMPPAAVETKPTHRVQSRPKPITDRDSSQSILWAALVGAGVVLGALVWMSANIFDRINDSQVVENGDVVVKMPTMKRKGRMGVDTPKDVEALVPVLEHTPQGVARLGDDLTIEVEVQGSKAYDKVLAWYRPTGQTQWSKTTLRRVGSGYRGSIPMTRIFADGVEYWVEAKPYTGGLPSLSHGSRNRPVRVRIDVN